MRSARVAIALTILLLPALARAQATYDYGDLDGATTLPSTAIEQIGARNQKIAVRHRWLQARLDMGDVYLLGSGAWNGHLDFTANLRDGASQSLETFIYSLDIDQTSPAAVMRVDFSVHDPVIAVVDFTGVSLTLSTVTAVENSLRLVLGVEDDLGYGVYDADDAPIVPGNLTVIPGAAASKDVSLATFRWTLPGADQFFASYDLQVIKVEPDLNDRVVVDWSRAATIEVDVDVPQSSYQYTMTLGEGTGYYFWRVRPVGTFYPGERSDKRNYGHWSTHYDGNVASLSLYNFNATPIAATPAPAVVLDDTTSGTPNTVTSSYFYYYEFDEGINWIYSKVLTEGSRQSETITYANGLNQVKQVQTKLFSQDSVLATQTVHDFSGRPALVSLPAPVGDNKLLFKNQLFVKPSGGMYSAPDFDDDATIFAPNALKSAPGTPNHYYSPLNQSGVMGGYVPDAKSYPYARTLYYSDATGRVFKQAGAGAAMHLVDGPTSHNVTTFYGGTSQDELDYMFGEEAPVDTTVYKIVTVDPNKVTSVSYVAKAGQVLATCLSHTTGPSQLANLDNVGDEDTQTIVDVFPQVSFDRGEDIARFSKTLVVDHEGMLVLLDYQITPATFQIPCLTTQCYSADYHVEIDIRCPQEPFDPNRNITMSFDVPPALLVSCATPVAPVDIDNVAVTFSHDTTGTTFHTLPDSVSLSAGTYQFEKRVFINTIDPSGVPYLDQFVDILVDSSQAWTAEENCCGPVAIDSSGFDCTDTLACCDPTPDVSCVADTLLSFMGIEQGAAYKAGLPGGGVSLLSNPTNFPDNLSVEMFVQDIVDHFTAAPYNLAANDVCHDLWACIYSAGAFLERNVGIATNPNSVPMETDPSAMATGGDLEALAAAPEYDPTFDVLRTILECLGYDPYNENPCDDFRDGIIAWFGTKPSIPTGVYSVEIDSCVPCGPFTASKDSLVRQYRCVTAFFADDVSTSPVTLSQPRYGLSVEEATEKVCECIEAEAHTGPPVTTIQDTIVTVCERTCEDKRLTFRVALENYLHLINASGNPPIFDSGDPSWETAFVQTIPELVTNGNFDLGTAGWTPGNTSPMSGSQLIEGEYTVVPDASQAHPGFVGLDHTDPGPGKMLVVNGHFIFGPGSVTDAWTTSVAVAPNTDYMFSCWANNVLPPESTYADPIIGLRINGQAVGTQVAIPESPDQWVYIGAVWNSGSNTTANLLIRDYSPARLGNDFAIDDVSFKETGCGLDDLVDLMVEQCKGQCALDSLFSIDAGKLVADSSAYDSQYALHIASEAFQDVLRQERREYEQALTWAVDAAPIGTYSDFGDSLQVQDEIVDLIVSGITFDLNRRFATGKVATAPAAPAVCSPACDPSFLYKQRQHPFVLAADNGGLAYYEGTAVTNVVWDPGADTTIVDDQIRQINIALYCQADLTTPLASWSLDLPATPCPYFATYDQFYDFENSIAEVYFDPSGVLHAVLDSTALGACVGTVSATGVCTDDYIGLAGFDVTSSMASDVLLVEVGSDNGSVYATDNVVPWKGSTTATAAAIAAEINASLTLPNYTAESAGATVLIYAGRNTRDDPSLLSVVVAGRDSVYDAVALSACDLPLKALMANAGCTTAADGMVAECPYGFFKLGDVDCGVCMRWIKPFIPVYAAPVHVFTCQELTHEFVVNATAAYLDSCRTAKVEEVRAAYRDALRNVSDEFALRYGLSNHHFTLYYYDRANNLLRTVPPEGFEPHVATDAFKHRLGTTYEYNSIKQLIRQTTPDGGATRFWYNAAGQLVLSQDAVQVGEGMYSYTRYDALGRIVEVGKLDGFTPTFLDPEDLIASELWTNRNFPYQDVSLSTLYGSAVTEVVYTQYSTPEPGVSCGGLEQHHLRNRVSKTWTDDGYATYYSYDPHGNVEWVVQELSEIGRKSIRYEYDLVSGHVNRVYYNEGTPEAFIHRYHYDADNRFEDVETSTDGIVWDRDAGYTYYMHGPLAREEIGQDLLQGEDFIYTTEGFLKSINHAALDSTLDPGFDGKPGSSNENFLRDEFGMELGYYDGDYDRPGTNIGQDNASVDPFEAANGAGLLSSTHSRELFNGNIAHWMSNIRSGQSAGAGVNPLGLKMRAFRYDVLNRLKLADFEHYDGSWVDGMAADDSYDERFRYDSNGNITSVVRNGYAAMGIPMDSLTYHYKHVLGTGEVLENRLYHVNDAVAGDAYTDDLEDQGPFDSTLVTINQANNYRYDAEGNLIHDEFEGLDIRWNVINKVDSVLKSDGTRIAFEYDAGGNRVLKRVLHSSGNSDDTFYVRDAGGNVMAIYKKRFVASPDTSTYQLAELPIYGSSRLGLYEPALGLNEFLFAVGSGQGFVQHSGTNDWVKWIVPTSGDARVTDFTFTGAPSVSVVAGSGTGPRYGTAVELGADDGFALGAYTRGDGLTTANLVLVGSDLSPLTGTTIGTHTGVNARPVIIPRPQDAGHYYVVYGNDGGAFTELMFVDVNAVAGSYTAENAVDVAGHLAVAPCIAPIAFSDGNSRLFVVAENAGLGAGMAEVYEIAVSEGTFSEPALRARVDLQGRSFSSSNELAVSPGGHYLAMTLQDPLGTVTRDVVVWNLDAATAELSARRDFDVEDGDIVHCEFTNDEAYLYCCDSGETNAIHRISLGDNTVEAITVAAAGVEKDIQRLVGCASMVLAVGSELRRIDNVSNDDVSLVADGAFVSLGAAVQPGLPQQTPHLDELMQVLAGTRVESEFHHWAVATKEGASTGMVDIDFDDEPPTVTHGPGLPKPAYHNVAIAENSDNEVVLKAMTIQEDIPTFTFGQLTDLMEATLITDANNNPVVGTGAIQARSRYKSIFARAPGDGGTYFYIYGGTDGFLHYVTVVGAGTSPAVGPSETLNEQQGVDEYPIFYIDDYALAVHNDLAPPKVNRLYVAVQNGAFATLYQHEILDTGIGPGEVVKSYMRGDIPASIPHSIKIGEMHISPDGDELALSLAINAKGDFGFGVVAANLSLAAFTNLSVTFPGGTPVSVVTGGRTLRDLYGVPAPPVYTRTHKIERFDIDPLDGDLTYNKGYAFGGEDTPIGDFQFKKDITSFDYAPGGEYIFYIQKDPFQCTGVFCALPFLTGERNVLERLNLSTGAKEQVAVYGEASSEAEVRRAQNDRMYVNLMPQRSYAMIGLPGTPPPAPAPISQLYYYDNLLGPVGSITSGTLALGNGDNNYGLPLQPYRVYEDFTDAPTRTIVAAARHIGDKRYELTDHLGNVRAVLSDIREWNDTGDNVVQLAENTPVVETWGDYEAFGALVPSRELSSHNYRYGAFATESDDEIKGIHASDVHFSDRMYDSRLGRFNSGDRMLDRFPALSPYQYASNTPIWAIDFAGLESLILWGGSRETNPDGTRRKHGISDNNTFKKWAEELNRTDYGSSGEVVRIQSAQQIIEHISQYDEGFIATLDIFAHMTPLSIQLSQEENVNIGFYSSWAGKKLVEQYFRNYVPDSEGYAFSEEGGARNIDEIDYSKFADDVICELHGCRAGMELMDFIEEKKLDERLSYLNSLLDNIAINMSQDLYKAGKQNAVVIAHKTASTPNAKHGYRHGARVVYHNGEVLLETTKKGDLSRVIKRKLEDKLNDQNH